MLKHKRVWIPILIVLLAVVGCGLYYGRKTANQEPVTIITPVEVEPPTTRTPKPPPPGETHETGHWHGDEWHSEPHDAHAPGEVSERPVEDTAVEAPTPVETAEAPPAVAAPIETETNWVNPTSTSSNPLFADGVPKHLQCPPELIGVYFKEIETETVERLQQRAVEILEKWNPNRSLTEVYPAFIEAERWYHANADSEYAGISMAAHRIDWQFQITLDFPEIGVLAQEDTDRFFHMRMIGLGNWSPDFNMFELADGSGRTFRTDADKKYVFTWSSYTDKEDGFTSSTSTHTSGPGNGAPNAEVIHINLDEITDEELEALQGWNYNINPYTTGAYKLGDHR